MSYFQVFNEPLYFEHINKFQTEFRMEAKVSQANASLERECNVKRSCRLYEIILLIKVWYIHVSQGTQVTLSSFIWRYKAL